MAHEYHSAIRGATASEISDSVEDAIRRGLLAPGEGIPTVRGLAHELGVSPSTVAAAYRVLRTRGLLVTQGRRGSAVSARPPIQAGPPPDLPEHLRNLADGNPDRALLPDLAPALAAIAPDHVLYGESLVDGDLGRMARDAFAADGIPASGVAVVGGALDGLERVLLARLRPGDRIAVEDPGFTGVLDLLAALGLEAVPVSIDDAGILPDALERTLAAGVEALVVTPRAQNPLGAALDAARCRALQPVLARHPDVLLFEDDHAGAVSGAPAHTLVEGSRPRWAVVRSVAKTLGPDLRLAVLAADEATLARVEGRHLIGMRWVSHLLQRIVVVQWRDRGVARALRSAERVYTKRRQLLVSELARRGVAAHGRSGLNVWVPVGDEGATVRALAERGWAVAPGDRFRLRSGPAIRICIATLTPEEARALATDLQQVLAAPSRVLGRV